MDLDVVFLGTSGSAPTAQRGLSATLIRRGGERLLFDCGEGTQRQLLRSQIGLVDLHEIFVTHYHADHFLGLPGLLKTYALRGREAPITIYGPPGLQELFTSLRRIFGRLTYPYELTELVPGDVLVRDDYELRVFRVVHTGASIGYALGEEPRPGRFDVETADALGVPPGRERGVLQSGQALTLENGRVVRPEEVLGPARDGRRVVLTGDTAPSTEVRAIARGADLLVHEATFTEDERARAEETLHSTAAEAAAVARDADVKLLALTHLSTRYARRAIAEEAREVFPDTVVPKDFDTVEIPFPERGEPRLVKGGAAYTAPPPETLPVQVP